MRKLLLLLAVAVISLLHISLSYAQVKTNLHSTKVIEGLKGQLNGNGEFDTLKFADGTSQTTASGGTVDGTGTTDEITYWVDSDTVGALAVATYPSLTELTYVKGVSSAIQTQLGLKAPLASPTFTGTVIIPTPFTIGAVSMTSTGTELNILDGATLTVTELNYVDGVTSAIQTQLDGKSPTAGNASLVTVGTITSGVWNGTDVPVSAGGTGLSTITALSAWVANSANTITEVTPGAGNSIRVNAGGTAWEAFTPGSGSGDMVLADIQTVTGAKTFGSAGAVGKLKIAGTTSGALTVDTSAVAGTATITIPAVTDTLVGKATTDTLTNKTFDADGTGNSITNIENADIKAAAAIAVNKLAALTASEIAGTDGSGFLTSLAVATYPSLTELTYVKGVTSAIQTQFGLKAPLDSPVFTTAVTLPVGLTGVIRTDTGVVSVDTDVTDLVTAASLTAAGKVELLTTAEINTGTDSTRAMPIDQYVASNRNVRYLALRIVEATTDVAVASTKGGDIEMPFAGTITGIGAYNDTAGNTGTMTIDVHLNGTTVMTTNKITIDTAEKTSRTAAVAPALTTTAVAVGDILTIDNDAVHTTAAKGETVWLSIRMD